MEHKSLPGVLWKLEAVCKEDANLTQGIIILFGQINKSNILQWIPAHVGIGGNECAYVCVCVLAKENRDLDESSTVTSEDANVVAKRKISSQHFMKPTLPELNCPTNVSSTVARLHMVHFKGMKISPDKTRFYSIYRNCLQTQRTSDYIFDCKTILSSLFKLDALPHDLLYSPQAPDLSSLVLRTFGPI
ncbi:hypothetical protein TNCV_4013871 [Trichonephila clavipes]|nr:hypothetical protein TNCV_4013871 [Trichonephila clavipes]